MRLSLAFPGLLMGVVAGCSSGTPAPGVGATRMQVHTAAADFQSGLPGQLDLALGTTASVFQVGVSASRDQGVWSANAFLTREQVVAPGTSLAIGSTGDAVAGVRVTGTTTLVADTGTLFVTFGHGTIAGTVSGASADFLDGSFAGDLAVTCWVPEAALTAAGGTTSSGGGTFDPDGGTEPLVADEGFVTPACMPFKDLAH